MGILRVGLWTLILATAAPGIAWAQGRSLDVHFGPGWFFDESAISHAVIGIGASARASDRFTLRGTLTHMRGPGSDRDWFALAHVTFDIVTDRPQHPVVPYLALGAGAFRHTDTMYGRDSGGTGPAMTLTAGARVRLGDRWFIAPEGAIGVGPHARVGVVVGVRR
jgi:hypothetical protein